MPLSYPHEPLWAFPAVNNSGHVPTWHSWTSTMLVIVINMVNTNQLNYGRKSVWRKQSHTCKWTVMIQQQPIFVSLQQYAKIGCGSSSLTGKMPWLKLSSHTKMTNSFVHKNRCYLIVITLFNSTQFSFIYSWNHNNSHVIYILR